jgi:Amt family ammonium transporter
LWVAWYGFNSGSTTGMTTLEDADIASHVALMTTIAAAMSGCTALLLARTDSKYAIFSSGSLHRTGVDVKSMSNGILTGLVAITAGCDCVNTASAICIGVVAAFVYYFSFLFVGPVLRIDDVVDAVPVHMAGGWWGTLAVGLFHSEQGLLTTGSFGLLYSQAIGVVAMTVMASTIVFCIALSLHFFDLLRVDLEKEAEGLDTEFGITAYVHESATMQKLRACHDILASYGFDSDVVISALEAVKMQIILPFSPQAGDNLIKGLSHLA